MKQEDFIAIGAGIIDGAGFGDNTKAAIMTRGVAEISRLGLAMGANSGKNLSLKTNIQGMSENQTSKTGKTPKLGQNFV